MGRCALHNSNDRENSEERRCGRPGLQRSKKAGGKDRERFQKFAIEVKGHELAGWNVHVSTGRAVCYATANRGACHLNGSNRRVQNNTAMNDCTGIRKRVYNLEKAMNYREGFRREDDRLPDRFFEEPLTVGPKKGAVLNRDEFSKIMDNYYKERGWDIKTSKPGPEKLKSLGLEFVLKEIGS